MSLVTVHHQYPKDVFVVNRWILRFAGLWAPETRSKLIQIPYHIYVIVVFLFANVYFTATEFVSLFYTYQDIYDFIKNVNFFLTHFMGAVKVVFWYFKGDVLIHLMDVLEDEQFHYKPIEEEEFKPAEIWEKYRKTGVRYSLSFLLLAHMTLSSSYVPPLLTAAFKPPPYQPAPGGNGSSSGLSPFYERLPYFSWMPFEHITPGTYLLALGYQAGPMFSYAYSIVGMDSLFMNIMNFIAANLAVLQQAFKAIRSRALHQHQQQPNTPFRQNVDEEIMNKEMKRTCRHLQAILKVCDDLEGVHKYVTMAQATATLFILCTCLYLISTTPIGSKQFFAEIVYMVAMGFQLYMYCWFGNEVTLMAKEMPAYIFGADWIDCCDSFKKSMVFTMLRMKKPIYMTVGKFAPLTLETFVTIIKTSYSIFAVIKNTDVELE